MAHREFKERLYAQFARVAGALASERRLEIIDLLAQAPRHVEALASETDMSVASTSQHLQVLRHAHLVESERDGTKVRYRLAGANVVELWLALRSVAEQQLTDVPALLREFGVAETAGHVAHVDLPQLIEKEGAVLIDVRPAIEFDSGHLPGAISIPIDEIETRLEELPRDRRIIAYCRGKYCLFADEAVALLRERGYDAARVDAGWPEWMLENSPAGARRPHPIQQR